ncbi:MAG: SDR family oxidoreductase [Chloroflexi bacterium]|nr:SDR family oxidoreductase [Chloroflexota bacterium]
MREIYKHGAAVVGNLRPAGYHLGGCTWGKHMRLDLSGQVALVTGSARRVGRAIALELGRNGVNMLVHYNGSSEDDVKGTVREIKSFGVDAFAVQADIGQPEGVESLFAAVREHFGQLHILVNSASVFQKRTLMAVTLDDWRQTIDVNLTAPFLCTQAAVTLMRENDPPSGVIINISDRGAIDPWPEYAHHGISKAGLLALTKVTAASLGPEIRANAIIPGLVLKPDHFSAERWQAPAEATPLKRPGTAEDVARAVIYLASEDFITGAVLHVDGGHSVI